MSKLIVLLAGLLLLPQAFAQPLLDMGDLKIVARYGAYTNGQRTAYTVRVSNTGDEASSADANVAIYRSPDMTIDGGDRLIFSGSFDAPSIGPMQYVNFAGEDKFCQDSFSSGKFHTCMRVTFASGSVSSCSMTPFHCINSGTTRPGVADDKQGGHSGDPVSTFNGAFFKHFTADFDLGGPMPLRFARYYSSGYIKTTRHASAMGSNWQHNFDWSLLEVSASRVEITDNEGRLIVFTSADAGVTWALSGNLDIPYQLVNGGSNEYILGHPVSNKTYTFFVYSGQYFIAKTHGRLTEIKDAHGNSHTLSYTNNLLTSVADGLGRALTFNYDASDLMATVTDDKGRQVVFTHGGSNMRELLTSKDPLLKITSYSYDATHALPGLLTGYQRPAGNTPRTQTYQAGTGKVLTQTSVGNTTSFAYAGSVTTLTDAASKTLSHTHSAGGELTAVNNKAGNASSLSHDGISRRTGVTDTLGASTGYTYHAGSGRRASIAHANGQTTSFTYTARALGNITQYDRTKVTHNDTSTDQWVFNASGDLVTTTDRAGNNSSYTYNTRGQVLTATNVEAGVTIWTYNTDGTVATHKDAFNNTTTYGYDSKRRRNLITYPDTSTRTFVYDDNGRIVSRTDQNGNTTTYSYDNNNNINTVTNRGGEVKTFTYDALDRVTVIEDTSVPGKPAMVNTYDNLERLKDTTDLNGNKTSFFYDARNHLIKVTDPLAKNHQFSYDKEGVLTSKTDPLSHVSLFTSDLMGRFTQGRSPLGNNTDTAYDNMGRVTTVTDPLGHTSTRAYDARGLLASWSMPGAVSAGYTRNKLGQITRVTDPRGKFWDRAYLKGRLSSRTDPLGRTISYSYNNMSRVSVMTFPGALGTLSFTYDANGNSTRRLYSGAGPDLNFTYDNMDRLLTTNGLSLQRDILGRITNSNGIDASYDDGGRLSSVDLDLGGSSKTILYAYDANDRLTTVTDWVGGVTSFTYDNAGRLLTLTRPNGVVSSYSYDNDDKVASILDKKGPTTLSSHDLVRDAAGQVSTAMRSVASGPAFGDSTVSHSFNTAGQVVGFSYDAMGRLTNTNAGTTRTWDLASRMTSSNNGTASFYTYDGLGQRTSKTVGGGNPRTYVWNQALGLPSISIEKDNSTNLRFYVHTPTGRLLHSIDASGNSRHFYHYDEAGNTHLVSDDSGAEEVSYQYSPYGQLLAQAGNLDNPFTWQGGSGVMDDGNGQFYARARYYDVSTRRFISKDPIISIEPRKIDPYQYAAGNPLMFGDPMGLDFSWQDIFGVANEGASVVQVIVAIVDLATKASPPKLLGGMLATAGSVLGVIDDDTAELAGDIVVVAGAAEVVVSGAIAGTAVAGAGGVAAAGAAPITALVATSIWSAGKVIGATVEGVLLVGDLFDLYDASQLEDKQAKFLAERKAAKVVRLREEAAAAAQAQVEAASSQANATVASASSHRETVSKEEKRRREERARQQRQEDEPSREDDILSMASFWEKIFLSDELMLLGR